MAVKVHFEVVPLLNLTGDIQTRTAESVTVGHVVIIRTEGVVPMDSPTDAEFIIPVNRLKAKAILPCDLDVVISGLRGDSQCRCHGNRDCRPALVIGWYCFHCTVLLGRLSALPV